MNIDLLDLQSIVDIDKKKVLYCARQVLRAMKEAKSELSLLFVDDGYIKKLNKKYRRIDKKTDVLAFSMREGKGSREDSSILGDVVISLETARREAMRRKRPIQKEIELYLVHGILHLLGYRDDKEAFRNKMNNKQKELLEAM
ncbi:MAG: rRNA maturation RNase YbeY [Candidatus Omnitrophota bacterium]